MTSAGNSSFKNINEGYKQQEANRSNSMALFSYYI